MGFEWTILIRELRTKGGEGLCSRGQQAGASAALMGRAMRFAPIINLSWPGQSLGRDAVQTWRVH